MAYKQILKEPHLIGLWLSQILSSIGDQIYSIAIVWISVQTGGAAAGFVSGAGAISGLMFGLVGGVYADRWNKQISMIVVDVLRALTVLTLAAIGHFMPLNLWHLGIASVIVSGLGALFDPALAACLPELTQGDEKRLQAMNALMQVNHRLARTLGPGVAGWLVAVTSLHHFFTLDAITFLISAAVIFLIKGNYKWKADRASASKAGFAGIWLDVRRGGNIVFQHEQLLWAFILYIGANIAWSAAFLVGLPLWAKTLPNADVGTYGIIVATYGVGSVISNFVMGTIVSRRRMLFISVSQLIFAVGFAIVAISQNLPMACLGAMLAATGGPIGDIMLMVMLQTDVPREDLGKVFSLRMCVMYLGGSLGLILAPILYQHCSPQFGIGVTAAIFLLLGVVGLAKFGAVESPYHPYTPAEKNLTTQESGPEKSNSTAQTGSSDTSEKSL